MDVLAPVILIVTILFIGRAIKVVPQQSAWVVERLGKYHGTLSPGLNFLIPFIDRLAYRHSLKEIPLDVPSQVCITRDNTQLKVDGILYFQVTDPMRASYGSSDYVMAITQLAQTTLRSVIGKMELDRTFEEREMINAAVVSALDERCADLGREGAARRDQGSDTAGRNPARDAADHRRGHPQDRRRHRAARRSTGGAAQGCREGGRRLCAAGAEEQHHDRARPHGRGRRADRHRDDPDACRQRRERSGASVVVGRIQAGKQHLGVAEAAEVAHPHRVEHADQVIAFVLHHPGMKAVGDAVDRLATLVAAGVADA